MSKTSHLTLKLRIKKPGKHLIQTFRKHLGDARFVHNSFLFERNFDFDDYLEEVESRQCWGEASTKEEARKLSTPPAWLNGYTFDRRLPSFKEMYPFLKDSYSSTLQKVAQNLERTYIKFIDGKCGLPHFKRKDAKEESIRFPSGVKFDQDNCQVYLPKIGWVRYFDDGRRIQHPEKIKAATLKRTDDQYDLLLTFKKECPEPKKIDPAKHKGTGLDVGTKYLLTNELGEHQESLSTKTKTFEERKAKKQKRLKNKTKGSRAYSKYLHEIRKLDTKIVCIRRDTLHKLSSNIVKNHDYAAVEKLQIPNLVKSAKGTIDNPGKNVKAKTGLNRAILRQGWGMLFNMLEYKFKLKGGALIKVPAPYTSQTCPKCGHVSSKNRVSQSKFKCEKCGYEDNADKVGALNVLRRAGRARFAGQVNHLAPE